MIKYVIIDERMRNIEKDKLKFLGYKLIELKKNPNIYEEISSHVDIFCSKINKKIIAEESAYKNINKMIENDNNIIQGISLVGKKYPEDIKYNVCIVGNKAIHNFKYTDREIIEELKREKFELINVNQGYSNCGIVVIDEKSIITKDTGIFNILKKYDLDILYIDWDLDIKLIKNKEYSKMNGFIGGAISKVENKIIVFGDLNKIDKKNKIRSFIEKRNLEIIDFKGLDVIDYGGIIEYSK